jgi:hypothetical protein
MRRLCIESDLKVFWLAGLLLAAAACDDDGGNGAGDAGGGDTALDTGTDGAGDVAVDQGADGASGAWLFGPNEAFCGMVVEQDGSSLTGSVYGDRPDEAIEIQEGTVEGQSVAFSLDLDGPVDFAFGLEGDYWMSGSITPEGEDPGDLLAVRTTEEVVLACAGGTPVAADLTGGWAPFGMDGTCGLVLTQTGTDVTGTSYGDGESEEYAVTGTVNGTAVLLEYSFPDGTLTLDLTLQENGMGLEGTWSREGGESGDALFGRVPAAAIEECPDL